MRVYYYLAISCVKQMPSSPVRLEIPDREKQCKVISCISTDVIILLHLLTSINPFKYIDCRRCVVITIKTCALKLIL